MNKFSRILLSGAIAVAATTGLVATAPAASAQCPDETDTAIQAGGQYVAVVPCFSLVDDCVTVAVYFRVNSASGNRLSPPICP